MGCINTGFLDRYRAESADVLDAILAHSRDCIKLLTLNGDLEYVSASAKIALGLADTDEAIGQAWRTFWPESAREVLDDAVLAAAAGISARFKGVTRGADGKDRNWEVVVSPVRGTDRLITHLLAVSTDVTALVQATERGRQRWEIAEEKVGQADVIAHELRHRLKNQLAVVGAVAKLLARHTSDSREMVRKLEEKLVALARAQDLLTILRDKPIGAREAVEQILQASGAGERVEVAEMPDTALLDESVQQLALILGELQTNALKHGALADEGGRVTLSGRENAEVLTLFWREQCDHPVMPVEEGGGGFQLIRRLGSAAGEHPDIVWDDGGIAVEFHVRIARRSVAMPGALTQPTL